MKIQRLLQVAFVSGSVCAAVPAFAAAALHGPVNTPSCGGDSDDDDDDGDDEDDKDGETRLCGGDSDDDDDGDDGDDDDGDETETRQL
jgi:hypothetical protein